MVYGASRSAESDWPLDGASSEYERVVPRSDSSSSKWKKGLLSMITLLPYLIGAILIAGGVFAGYQYVDNNWQTDAGIAEGKRLTKAEWDAANAKAILEAKEQRDADEAVAQAEAKKLEGALANQRRLNRELAQAVQGHIAAAKFPVDCKLTPELHNDWNRAASGSQEGNAGRGVSKPGGGTPPADRSVNSGTGLKLPASR